MAAYTVAIAIGIITMLGACDDDGTRGFVAADSDATSSPDGASEDGVSDGASEIAVPDGASDSASAGDADAAELDATTDASGPECVAVSDCAARHPEVVLGPCAQWACTSGTCEDRPRDAAALCEVDGVEGRCVDRACVFRCGDGVVQTQRGETCDDGGNTSGDGCRDDCLLEEAVGAGWSGGQCDSDAACAPAGSLCIPDVGGGSCAIACTTFCDDEPGAPVTFCVDAAVYESRMQTSLPPELSQALCVARCDFVLFPRSGCREGLHCELQQRYESLVEDEVCVPGPWSVGLQLSADGSAVLGFDGDAPAPAEPYATLLTASCGGVFAPIEARLFRGLAATLLAMGSDGRGRTWERLCAPPTGLPTWYGLHAEAQAGRAFRLVGARLEIVDWTAAAVYGSTAAKGWRVGGPLYASRVMVFNSDASAWLYADAAADRPYADPERGRHFGAIEGDEWAPLDTVLEPNLEYTTFKASGGQRFHRQWGRLETVEYLADMALDYLVRLGIPLGIGDVSLATGGDIDDHASHEVGLDVDLYLLTFPPNAAGELDLAAPRLWVSECAQTGQWDCWYYEATSDEREDPNAPLHVAATRLLETLAQYALDWSGPSHFVQHDVVTLAPFRALGGSTPRYVDATNDDALGWPPHLTHVHLRFFDW